MDKSLVKAQKRFLQNTVYFSYRTKEHRIIAVVPEIATLNSAYQPCTLLKANGLCHIYADRPLDCRLYPLKASYIDKLIGHSLVMQRSCALDGGGKDSCTGFAPDKPIFWGRYQLPQGNILTTLRARQQEYRTLRETVLPYFEYLLGESSALTQLVEGRSKLNMPTLEPIFIPLSEMLMYHDKVTYGAVSTRTLGCAKANRQLLTTLLETQSANNVIGEELQQAARDEITSCSEVLNCNLCSHLA